MSAATSKLVEVNFDGIVGPSHNYAGLSLGNIASASHKGSPAFPRAAALQGVAKMRGNLERFGYQGFLLPLPRPDAAWSRDIGADEDTGPALIAAGWSASSMWTANAATVSPAPDTRDGRCHLTVANLVSMPHRSIEWPDTHKQLSILFADTDHFQVNRPVPPCFGDEGAANHMRLSESHDGVGTEVFVYGKTGGAFPARQHVEASRAIARRHGLDPARTVFIEQNPQAIAAGAFHNDVVAVANGNVLFTHERAFSDREGAYDAMRAAFPALQIVEVPESAVSLDEAIRTYLFNAQLVTRPDHGSNGGMTLIVPEECRESDSVWRWCEAMLKTNGPIREVVPVDVRQSMANGGGPACLRLRVVCDPSTVDPRFLLSAAKADQIEACIAAHWPEQIDPADIGKESLAKTIISARNSLLETLDLTALS